MAKLTFGHVLFGHNDFHENAEYQEFQFKFLAIILLSGALFTSVFLLGEVSKINPLNGSLHLYSMAVFSTVSLILWRLLRGHQERFLAIAWTFQFCCLLEYISALAYVPQDELRVLWFFTNIPGAYIILGQRAGALVTALIILNLGFGNQYLSAPYSPNALATLIVSMLYIGAFFHVYGSRTISYVTRLQQSNEKLQYMATHDPLTGAFNRRAYHATCEQLIHFARRHATPFSILFVDLDHFKRINDTHGHEAGDIVLKAVAGTLTQSIRNSDVLGRIGGEEFSIFLPNTDLSGALLLAESIRRSIEQLMPTIETGALKITASIGVAVSHNGDQTMQEIQQQADQAMYVAKNEGRNKVCSLAAVPLEKQSMQAA